MIKLASILKEVPLHEGPILLHQEDKNAIYAYIDDMKQKVDGYLMKQNKNEVESEDLITMMNRFSENSSLNIFPFNIEYIFNGGNATGYYDKHTNTIIFIVSHHCKWRAGFNNSYLHVFNVSSVNFKSIIETFIHEFTHYIQHEFRHAKTGDYELSKNWSHPTKYYKRGWERQAHAMAYLEKLKQELEITEPTEILSQLRKMGVLHNNDLNQLKKSDYKSWKAIMKQAIMATMADIEDTQN